MPPVNPNQVTFFFISITSNYNNLIKQITLFYIIYVLYSSLHADMSFFFNKPDNEENLRYDDTAFMHFAISICILGSLVFTGLIIKELTSKKQPNLAKIANSYIFQQKLKKTMKRKKKFMTLSFLVKVGLLIICAGFGFFCYSQIRQDSKMLSFDPYEILGVQMDAPLNIIKKTYRKLALEYHPDRNSNNPQANAKFIQITKAYKCLSDQKAKQNCIKYGNPDGETYIKVGIGLPRFMIDSNNQYTILIPIFILLLFVIPFTFIKWSSRLKPTDKYGNLLANYGMFYELITPAMNQGTFSIIMGSMKEMQTIFPKRQIIQSKLEKDFKEHLLTSKTLSEEQLKKISPYILYQCLHSYSYVGHVSKNEEIAYIVPQLCRKIISFTLYYAQKGNDQKLIENNPAWKITFHGYIPTLMAIKFSKKNYNPSILIQNAKSFQFIDLTQEQLQMVQTLQIPNLQYHLLWNDNAIKSVISHFRPERQLYISQQLQSLPALRIQAKLLLADHQVKILPINDFAFIQIKIIKKKKTPGYVISKDYPFLVREEFWLMVTYDINLIFFCSVLFDEESLESKYKFPYRQAVQKDMKFDIYLISGNYPNMDLRTDLQFKVVASPNQNRLPTINKQDKNIQKIPKSFFEAMTSIDQWNSSDRELSDGSDDQGQQKDKEKQQGGEGRGCFKEDCGDEDENQGDQEHDCCGHSHGHGHGHGHGEENIGFKEDTGADNQWEDNDEEKQQSVGTENKGEKQQKVKIQQSEHQKQNQQTAKKQ